MSFPKETAVSDQLADRSLPVGPLAGAAVLAQRGRDELPLLSLVVPFYNEQEMIPHFFSGVIPEL